MSKSQDMKNHENIARYIEYNQEDVDLLDMEHVKRAEDAVPLQAAQVKNTCNQANPQVLALFGLNYKLWELDEKKKSGGISQEDYDRQKHEATQSMEQIVETPDTPASKKILATFKSSARAVHEILMDDKKRASLHQMSLELQNTSTRLDNKTEQKALALLPQEMQDTYRSQTMDNNEKKVFWKKTSEITRDKMTRESAVKLLALHLSNIAREESEVIDDELHKKTAPTHQKFLGHEKQKSDRGRQDKAYRDKEIRQDRTQERNQIISGVKSGMDKVLQESGSGLTMETR